MVEKRSDKLKRLVTVQRQLEKMAEIDLADTNRERDHVALAIDTAVSAMNSLTPTHRVFGAVYARRLSGLTARDQRLTALAETHKSKVMAERAKADRLEESMDRAGREEDREADDAALLDLLDQVGAAGTQGSGKLRRS